MVHGFVFIAPSVRELVRFENVFIARFIEGVSFFGILRLPPP